MVRTEDPAVQGFGSAPDESKGFVAAGRACCKQKRDC